MYQHMADEDYGENEIGFDRMLAITDGAFAFAMTLLALNLSTPNLLNLSESELPKTLLNEIPQFAFYVESFFIVWFIGLVTTAPYVS